MILTVNGIVGTALFLSAEKTVDYLTTTDEFGVTQIDVRGVERASADAIDAGYRDFADRWNPILGEAFSERFPAYTKLDLVVGYTRVRVEGFWKIIASFLYARRSR